MSLVQCYVPTNNSEEGEKALFYTKLQEVVGKVPKRDMSVLVGELNAREAEKNKWVRWKWSEECEGNRKLFTKLCAFNEPTNECTPFFHRRCHKINWVSPDPQTGNQIDHIRVCQ